MNIWGKFFGTATPDPYNQHYSPFTGMGNNPVVRIDPSGGYEDGWNMAWDYINEHAQHITESWWSLDHEWNDYMNYLSSSACGGGGGDSYYGFFGSNQRYYDMFLEFLRGAHKRIDRETAQRDIYVRESLEETLAEESAGSGGSYGGGGGSIGRSVILGNYQNSDIEAGPLYTNMEPIVGEETESSSEQEENTVGGAIYPSSDSYSTIGFTNGFCGYGLVLIMCYQIEPDQNVEIFKTVYFEPQKDISSFIAQGRPERQVIPDDLNNTRSNLYVYRPWRYEDQSDLGTDPTRAYFKFGQKDGNGNLNYYFGSYPLVHPRYPGSVSMPWF